MKKLIIGLALVVLLLVPLAACAAADKFTEGTSSVDTATADEGEAAWGGEDADYDYGDAVPTELDSTDAERMIIRNGNISLVVEDINQAVEDITGMASAFGGYVVYSNIRGEEEDMEGWIYFRVPDEDFDAAMAQLRDLAVQIESESTSTQDVTEEYIDLESRLRNAEAIEAEYLALLDKAEDVDDILRIYNYLSDIRYEIEYIEGRMQYLEQLTSTSLIEVYLQPEASVSVGWNAGGVFKAAANGLLIAGKVLANMAIWLLIFIPIWGTALGIFLWQRHKKKKAKQQ